MNIPTYSAMLETTSKEGMNGLSLRFFLIVSLVFGLVSHLSAATSSFDIAIALDGTTTVDGRVIPDAVRPDPKLTAIIVLLVKEVPEPQTRLTVNLTLPVVMGADWQPRLRPNRCTCQVKVERTGERTFTLTAGPINAGASVSFEAEFAPAILQLPASARAVLGAERASPWLLGLALLILLCTLGFLAWLIWELYNIRKFRLDPTPADQPPNETSPAVMSLIPSGKITDHTLAAMLIDLAERGFVRLAYEQDQWVFAEARPIDLSGPGFALGSFPGDQIPEEERAKVKQEGLTMAEKYLLAKLFTVKQRSITERDFRSRLGRHLSSWKIGKLYAELYREVTAAGLFIRNPHDVHLRYRGLGMSVFFVGLLGFILSFFLPGDKLFLQLTLVLIMVSGRVVTKMVPYLPLLTVMGQAEWARWAGFRAYLATESPVEASVPGSRFYNYLGYALAFDSLEAWAHRFASRKTAAPVWLKTETKEQLIDEAAREMKDLRTTVAHNLAAIHEHTVR